MFPHFPGAKDAFTVSLFRQGTKAERGQKGDLGFKGDLVGLIRSLDCSRLLQTDQPMVPFFDCRDLQDPLVNED